MKIKWRTGSLSTKEFQELPKIKKEEYIKEILKVPVEERGHCDNFILRFYSTLEEPVIENKKFFDLTDISN